MLKYWMIYKRFRSQAAKYRELHAKRYKIIEEHNASLNPKIADLNKEMAKIEEEVGQAMK